MMPTVCSGTASSMPAFAASSSTNSSMVPRPRPVGTGSPCSENHLELGQYEIQAINHIPGTIHLHSRPKCCSNARAVAETRAICRACQRQCRLLTDHCAKMLGVASREPHV